ncbi:DNA gyrase inhibitor YacG [Aquisalimonas sp.]|uniref:DNA gyrase inhibitor YacG n=1 Tax=unclassified Aquisalimonas TaxID=2644645 RepID=UPI0025BF7DEF|nr:DNA gyrase inhibitor YacG [Aquisalimonas sp.]
MSNRNAPCPNCRKLVDWDGDSPWRPFCSERCKSVDLGGWLQESHRIPGIELPEELLDEIGDEQDPANQ